jgi:site-specific DNA-methyltransferase (adenine-specific)
VIDLTALTTDPLLLVHGDCIEQMATMPENSIDAIVTDPPYGLEFMGKGWDSFRVDGRAARWSAEKSGGAGAGFAEAQGGTVLPSYHKRRSTSQCRTCGKRDAFRNPHKCGDKAEWVTVPVDNAPIEARAFENWCHTWATEAYRILKPGGYLLSFGGSRTYHRMASGLEDAGFNVRDSLMWLYGQGFPKSLDVSKAFDNAAGEVRADRVTTEYGANEVFSPTKAVVDRGTPVSELAKQWSGWGTALKPAHEPIVMAQKPVDGTYVYNLRKWGVGALNVEGARVNGSDSGRWPTNVLLAHSKECVATGEPEAPMWTCVPDCPVLMLDAQSGERPGGAYPAQRGPGVATGFGEGRPTDGGARSMGDTGGASRFFYVAKASTSDRGNNNTHPTVKPVDLMRYLVRLVTPPRGIVLDPFAGSGTTGQAALAEGFRCVLIEKEAEYVEGIRKWRGAMQLGLGLSA